MSSGQRKGLHFPGQLIRFSAGASGQEIRVGNAGHAPGRCQVGGGGGGPQRPASFIDDRVDVVFLGESLEAGKGMEQSKRWDWGRAEWLLQTVVASLRPRVSADV